MSPADQPTPSTVRSSRTSAVVAGVVGLIVVVGIASALGKPAADTIELIMIAGGAALITGALGGLALHLLRGRSFSAQVVVVALTSTAAVTAGSGVAHGTRSRRPTRRGRSGGVAASSTHERGGGSRW